MKTITNIIHPLFALFAFACFALAQNVQAVVPPPDGGYANQNTAEGRDALFSLTTGADNTAVGFDALHSITGGSFNTATGSNALLSNTTGFYNTATGVNALGNNTTGDSNTATGLSALISNTTGGGNTATGVEALSSNTTASNNTAIGVLALTNNTTGDGNTATGSFALQFNTTGVENTATGVSALYVNTTGSDNTATGLNALLSNTTGFYNTAVGAGALSANTGGVGNTATGAFALSSNDSSDNSAFGDIALYSNTEGFSNSAVGEGALYGNTSGGNNIGIGYLAGQNLTTGSNNIDIGKAFDGVAGEANTIRVGTQGTQTRTFIAGIAGVGVTGSAVLVSSSGHLGVRVSSARFKDAIKPMDKASEAILALKPVTFRYKKEIDPDRTPQFGLVAEQVEKVNPDLVVRDAEGKVYTVRYEAVNAMLLNEFLKEHRNVEAQDRKIREQEATIAKLKVAVAKQQSDLKEANAQRRTELKALAEIVKQQASQLQRVSAQLALQKPSAQTVANNQ
jgi:hypothetical protein